MALTDNIVSYWKLDEASGNAADSVGANTLTNSNATYAAGKINNGAVFNGTTAILSSSAFAVPTTALTFSAWINADTLPSSGVLAAVISKYTTAAQTGGVYILLYNDGGTQKIHFTAYNSSTGLDATASKTQTLSTSTWYYLVGTYTTAGGTKLYINGTEVATNTDTGDLFNPSGRVLTVGCQNYDGSNNVRFFDGMIDEVGVWSRALSSTEVTALYNGGAGLQYPFVGSGPANLKLYNTNAKANIKSINTNPIANVKSLNTNT